MLLDLFDATPKKLTELWKIPSDEQARIFSDAFMHIQSHKLNQVGSHIWYLCDSQRRIKDIADEVFKSIETGCRPHKELILIDVIDFVIGLKENHLIELAYPSRKADFLLISPPNSRYYHPKIFQIPENSSPPLGLCSIATCLHQNGFQIHLEDFQALEKSTHQIIPLIEQYAPRLIGISATTTSYPQASKMAATVKRYYPEIKLVLGGIHGSALPERTLMESHFDIIVRGEGEQTMLELAQAVPINEKTLSSIPGISYRTTSGAIYHNPDRAFIANLDDLPMPDKRLLDLYRYHQKGAILTGRGCPNQCIFCSCGAFSGRKYRARSIQHILTEIKDTVNRFGVREFEIHDDTFTISRDRVVSFCKGLLQEGLSVSWGCQSRASTIDGELARLMFEAGCRSIQFGVESGNQAVLNSIRKGITLEEVEKAVTSSKEAGIPNVICTFMVGHPEDTKATIRDTVDFALHLHDLGLTISPFTVLTPLPGTDVYHQAEKYGLTIIDDDWERYTFSKVNIETKHLTAEEIQEIYFDALETILTKEGRLNGT